MAALTDESLYSRQIAVYGEKANNQLARARVKILGFQGVGLELCKNLVLAGVNLINIIDDSVITIEDLSTNYFAEDNIGKLTMDIMKDKLSELNPYVNLEINNLNDDEYDVYILINNSIDKACEIDEFVTSINKKFIWVNSYGLMGNVFCNFNEFTSYDIDGETKFTSVLSSINIDGIFTTIESNPHNLNVGDKFVISDVKGLDINGMILTVSKVIDNYNFEVKEEIDFSKYQTGGRIVQEKQPVIFNHKSLESNMVNPSIINIDEDANDLHKLFLTYHGVKTESKFDKYINTFETDFMPVCSIIGSYAAQEVIKGITNKYTPTTQFYYYHCYDIYPKIYNPSFENVKDRYINMRKLFGDELFQKIRESTYFIVGAGAIGCEHLKNFGMIGLGNIIITDMDTIERSNLNRQFLFRNSHLGELKSIIAARQIMNMNPTINVTSHENKVCPETETVYNANFFDKIDGIANALDNIEARRYVDKRCIFYKKSLFESGTLGTKGNVQVIIPGKTEYYGESEDQKEETFPLCTIKNFPNSIVHIIPWAREEFEEMFNSYPNSWIKYVNDSSYINKITGNERGLMISNILYLYKNIPFSYEDCIKFAMKRFYEKFNHLIKQLLHAYPQDTITSSGVNFWSGGKRCPMPINFHKECEIMKEYIIHSSVLIAQMFNIEVDYNIIDVVLDNIDYKIYEFLPSDDVQISTDDKQEKQNEKKKYLNYDISDLPDIEELKFHKISIIEFEKDDDSNHHIDFIKCCSNLRALNYDIECVDRHEIKIIAGKIIPAIATTTSMISGLVTVELLKYIFGNNDREVYKNSFINLGLSMIMHSEPMPNTYNEIKGNKFTSWDYYELKEDVTIQQLFDELSKIYDVTIDTISYGNTIIISPMTNPIKSQKRLGMKVSEIITEFEFKITDTIIEFIVGCIMEEEEYDLPSVKYYIKI